MTTQKFLKNDPLPWLLESADPGVRYLALRDLQKLVSNDPELLAARREAHRQGPIVEVLAAMNPQGYWSEPGPGYNPKYFSSVWSLILLAELGAAIDEDERIQTACAYFLEHNLTSGGQFTINGVPSGTVDCLQGNICWALLTLGCRDNRLENAFDWMARTVTGEGLASQGNSGSGLRYYAYKCGPLFACGGNYKQSCAWGAVKVLRALSLLTPDRHTPRTLQALQQGVDFLFSIDPATAGYPSGESTKPNSSWWKFGFPVFYVTDILQVCEVLVTLGYGTDPRLANALQRIADKQDLQGRWVLEYDYSGKTWVNFGPKKQANKWVTLRALRALGKNNIGRG